MTPTELPPLADNDNGVEIEDYCTIAAALWKVQAKQGSKYMRRIVESVLTIFDEAGLRK